MINTLSILTGNILAIIIIVNLMLNIPYGFTHSYVQARVFTWFSIPIIFGAVFGIGYAIFDGTPGSFARVMSYISGTVDVVAPILMGCVFWIFVESTGKESLSALKKQIIAASVVMILTFIPVFLSYFNGIIFYIDESNSYRRGPLGLISYVVAPLILLFSVLRITYLKIRRRGFLFYSILSVVLPILVVGVIQVCYYGVIQTWVGLSIATLSLYIGMQKDLLYMDPMTKVFNRLYLDYIVSETEKKGEPIGGIMLDIDHFKRINDVLGHSVGDAVIKNSAYILKMSADDNTNVIRVGGDEFMVVMNTRDENDLLALMERIRENCKAVSKKKSMPTEITFSMGCDIFIPGQDTSSAWFNRMDKKMYIEKDAHRFERRNSRRAADDNSL